MFIVTLQPSTNIGIRTENDQEKFPLVIIALQSFPGV